MLYCHIFTVLHTHFTHTFSYTISSTKLGSLLNNTHQTKPRINRIKHLVVPLREVNKVHPKTAPPSQQTRIFVSYQRIEQPKWTTQQIYSILLSPLIGWMAMWLHASTSFGTFLMALMNLMWQVFMLKAAILLSKCISGNPFLNPAPLLRHSVVGSLGVDHPKTSSDWHG